MPMPVRFIRVVGAILLSVSVLVCSITLIYIWQWHEKTPTATTFVGMSRSKIPVVQLLSVETKSGEFYLWISTYINFFGMPSEPTAYAFNNSGNLLDWSLEADDWKSIGYYYNQRKHGVPIRIEEVIRRIDSLVP